MHQSVKRNKSGLSRNRSSIMPENYGGIYFAHRTYTYSVHDVDTVCSQARTNENACLWLKSRWLSCIIFVRLKQSIFRSAISQPCWSFPQHAALSGPRDVLQDNTVHRQPLPQEPLQRLPEQLHHEPLLANAIRSEKNVKESLSDPVYDSAGNLRINTPRGYAPKKFTTEEIATIPMMSPEEDIYQSCDVQRDFGEQDQQAPVVEETRGFGQILVQRFLDQEMARMSPIKKMSYLQSRMHIDESMESNADSDLEDGEIRKLMTSSLFAQGASGR